MTTRNDRSYGGQGKTPDPGKRSGKSSWRRSWRGGSRHSRKGVSKHAKVENRSLHALADLCQGPASRGGPQPQRPLTGGPDSHTHPLPPSLPPEPADMPFLVATPPRSSVSPERRGVCEAGCDLLLSPVSAAGLCTFLGNESDPPRQCLIRA